MKPDGVVRNVYSLSELSVLNHESKPMKRPGRTATLQPRGVLSVLNHESKPMKLTPYGSVTGTPQSFSTQPRVETDETGLELTTNITKLPFSTQPRVETDET